MAAEAEAAREARAKVVAAEGEQKASLHLKEAALVLEESTSALQLRYLQVIIYKLNINWSRWSQMFISIFFRHSMQSQQNKARPSCSHSQ